jgi:ferredoxin-type protein NapH
MKVAFFQRLSQLCSLILYNAYLAGFIGGTIYQGRLKLIPCPGFNCHSCPGALFVCPIGALQHFAAYGSYYISLYIIGFLGLLGAVFGRFICGWACPFGLLQDLLNKLPVKKISIPRRLEYLRYVVLVGIVFIVAAVTRQPWFCKLLCPAGTLEAGIPLMLLNEHVRAMIGPLFMVKMAILLVFLVWMAMAKRPFCRVVCPLGAIYGLCNHVSIFKLKFNKRACVYDASCAPACPVDHRMYRDDPNASRCIRCLRCRSVCEPDAISVTSGSPSDHSSAD